MLGGVDDVQRRSGEVQIDKAGIYTYNEPQTRTSSSKNELAILLAPFLERKPFKTTGHIKQIA